MGPLNVVVALTTRDNDYQAEQAVAVTEMAARLGVKIQIIYAGNDAVQQTQQLFKLIQDPAQRPNAILVPQRAVQQGAKGHFVWVVDKDNKAESRPVTVGQWHGDDWFIDEGLTSGERVVVDGAVTLAPGAPVQVTQTLTVSQPEAVAGAPK